MKDRFPNYTGTPFERSGKLYSVEKTVSFLINITPSMVNANA